MGKSYKRILLLGIGFILCGTLAAQEQKQDSTEGKNNIKASERIGTSVFLCRIGYRLSV